MKKKSKLKPKHKRLLLILGTLLVISIAAAIMLNALKENLLFFYTPTDLVQKTFDKDKPFRLGGMVKKGSVKDGADMQVVFTVTDFKNNLTVHYQGLLPNLFREGQGVVADGKLDENGVFQAHRILAKHDENYMPPVVAKAVKKVKEEKK